MKKINPYCITLFLAVAVFAMQSFAAQPQPHSQQTANNNASDQIVTALRGNQNALNGATVAVMPFDDLRNGENNTSGEVFAERLGSAMANAGNCTVVDKSRVNSAACQQQLSAPNADSSSRAIGTAQQVNASIVVTGTITTRGDVTEITARAVRVSDGVVIATTTVTEPRTVESAQSVAVRPTFNNDSQRFNNAENQYCQNNSSAEQRRQTHETTLQNLQQNNSQDYNRVRNMYRQLETLSQNDSDMFMVVTEPSGSRTLNQWLRNNPDKAQQVRNYQTQIQNIAKIDPYLNDYIQIHRSMVNSNNGNNSSANNNNSNANNNSGRNNNQGRNNTSGNQNRNGRQNNNRGGNSQQQNQQPPR